MSPGGRASRSDSPARDARPFRASGTSSGGAASSAAAAAAPAGTFSSEAAFPGPPSDASAASLSSRLKERALGEGFAAAGVCRLKPSEHAELLRSWLRAGRHGEMAYFARPDAVARRLDPRRYGEALRTALVVADAYPSAPVPGEPGGATPRATTAPQWGSSPTPRGAGRPGREARSDEPAPPDGSATIARYARGRDYHRVVKGKLRRLLRWLEAETGRRLPAARACVDTSAVLERELARRAGLGWYGRNTMLIHPRRGSYFFLGVLMTELDLAPDPPFETDHCGTCRACLDACPTEALLGRDENGAPVMDARRCISYLTIEHRGPIPEELRPAIGSWVFGCDICQEVCPWNSPKSVGLAGERDYRADWRGAQDHPGGRTEPSPTQAPSLVELMRMTYEDWDRWTRGSAIRRAGYVGLKRNVAVALGNWLATAPEPPAEAMRALRAAREDDEPMVREHAAWALAR